MTMAKNVLITGGSSGIGLAIAGELQGKGYRVISLSRSKNKIERAWKERPDLKEQIDFISGDVSEQEQLEKVKTYIKEKYGMLHGLVNNAGVLTKGTIETISLKDWNYTLDINLTGPYLLTKTLLPLLKKANGASIVNISSVAALKPGTSVGYSVSKAGLDMLTRFLAGDLGPYKIRVNSVNPGLVRTHIHLDNKVVAGKDAYEEMLEKARPRYPLGEIGEPADIAKMVSFLLSEEAKWVTGSIITVDGGVMAENDLIPPK
jgi:NAD(P)-dependent dehydrogenase (short-subunit alcohol dehydrogenase family)